MRSLSPMGAMVSRVMYRALWTAHSSFCSSRMAPISRVMAASLGKMPTTLVRRLISPLRRSRGFVEWSLVRLELRRFRGRLWAWVSGG